jgi:hypothetical protein
MSMEYRPLKARVTTAARDRSFLAYELADGDWIA